MGGWFLIVGFVAMIIMGCVVVVTGNCVIGGLGLLLGLSLFITSFWV